MNFEISIQHAFTGHLLFIQVTGTDGCSLTALLLAVLIHVHLLVDKFRFKVSD